MQHARERCDAPDAIDIESGYCSGMTVHSSADPQGPSFTHREILVVFAGIALAMLMAALDQTIVATALPVIAADLGGFEQISWIVSAYLLSSTATTLLYGKLSDLHGRRRLLEIGLVLFIIGSGLCAAAGTFWQLVAARAVQGAGGGGLMALSMTIIGDMVAPRERGRYQGYISAIFATASVAGPVLGGYLTEYLSWHWIFLINLPLGAIALLLAHRTLGRLSVGRGQARVDYWGAVVMVAGVVCLLLLVTGGGNIFPWLSAAALGLASSAIVLLALFVRRERRAPEALLPPRIFKSSVMAIGFCMIGVTAMVLIGVTIFLPLYLQVVADASVSSSGLLLLPLVGGVTVGAVIGGRLVSHTGRYKSFPILGLATAAVALALLGLLVGQLGYLGDVLILVLLGVGLGHVMPVITVAVQNAAAPSDLGTATSALSFFRSLGGAVGVAIFGAVLAARTTEVMAAAGQVVAIEVLLEQGMTAIESLPPALNQAVTAAFATAFAEIFFLATGITLVAFGLSWFLKELPLRSNRRRRGNIAFE